MTTLSSRDFNQDVGRAKRAARLEPVFITDRGRPTHVLLSFETYRQISGQTETIIDLLAAKDPATADTTTPEADTGAGWDRAGLSGLRLG